MELKGQTEDNNSAKTCRALGLVEAEGAENVKNKTAKISRKGAEISDKGSINRRDRATEIPVLCVGDLAHSLA